MDLDLLGQVCSLLAAVTWACALVLFKRGGAAVDPMALNLFKNVVGLVLLGTTLALQPGISRAWSELSRHELLILMISGVVGIAAADTLFFAGMQRIDVGIVAIVECTYSPFVILFSWLLLSERVSAADYLGGAMILCGVILTAPLKSNIGVRRHISGIVLVTLSMGLMAVGIVMAKPILEHLPLVLATVVRLLAGTAALVVILGATPSRAWLGRVFQPSRTWRYTLPAAVLSTYLSLLFWVGGFKYTDATVAAMLNQTSALFAIVLATVFLREPFTRRHGVAVTLALAGVAVVTLVGTS